MCVCVCACVDAVPVQCEGGGWGVLCDDALYVVTLLHTPHSRMRTPPQEDKCRLLPQPKSVPTEGEEGEGEGEEPLLNKMANQWMSTRDLMKVCACACVRSCVCDVQ